MFHNEAYNLFYLVLKSKLCKFHEEFQFPSNLQKHKNRRFHSIHVLSVNALFVRLYPVDHVMLPFCELSHSV